MTNRPDNPAFLRVFTKLTAVILRDAASAGTLSDEEIHDFRLAVKYLRTLLDIAEAMAGKKPPLKELRAILSPAFDAAGDLRTARINLGLLRKWSPGGIAGFRQALLADEAKSRGEFAALMARLDGGRLGILVSRSAAAIGRLGNARVSVRAEKFLIARYRAVSRILGRVKSPRDLHEVRKNVKSAKYALRLMAACGVVRRSGIEERILGAIDRNLGRWHDETVFLRRMKELSDARTLSEASRDPLMGGSSGETGRGRRLAPLVRDTRTRMTALRRASRLA